jgi:hypothetical protein
MDKIEDVYISDAVIASFDGFSIWLRTDDGNNQQIALEPQVLRALIDYAKSIDAHYGIEHFFKK